MVLTLLCNNVIQIFAADRHDGRHMLGLCCHRCCVVPSANRVTICLDARLGCFCADSSLQRASARVKSTHVSLRNVAKKKPIVDGVPPTDATTNEGRPPLSVCAALDRESVYSTVSSPVGCGMLFAYCYLYLYTATTTQRTPPNPTDRQTSIRFTRELLVCRHSRELSSSHRTLDFLRVSQAHDRRAEVKPEKPRFQKAERRSTERTHARGCT